MRAKGAKKPSDLQNKIQALLDDDHKLKVYGDAMLLLSKTCMMMSWRNWKISEATINDALLVQKHQ